MKSFLFLEFLKVGKILIFLKIDALDCLKLEKFVQVISASIVPSHITEFI